MGEWGGNFLEHQLCQNFKLCQSAYRKSDVLRLLWGFGRKRRSSEEGRERFWRKKGVRRVGLAYRELIGSLYESWTIGIERVCKKLINSLIQQCQKCQKWGFETKERESSPRPSPKERGCSDKG